MPGDVVSCAGALPGGGGAMEPQLSATTELMQPLLFCSSAFNFCMELDRNYLCTLAWELEHCASKLLKEKINLFTSQRWCFGAEGLVSALSSLLSKSVGWEHSC